VTPLISDLPGLAIGHADDPEGLTGLTLLLFDPPAAAGADVGGSAAGTRAIEQLRRFHVVDRIHGLLLAGGSTFGLGATDGALRWLEERGRGFQVGVACVPIVPAAIIFDLALGDAARRPDPEMAYRAAQAASSDSPAQGSVGVGMGATIGKIGGIERATKGGFGTACLAGPGGLLVGAVAAVNAFGDLRNPLDGQLLAGARAAADSAELIDSEKLICQGGTGGSFALENTTLVVGLTNAALDRERLIQVSGVMHDGLARVLSPVHTAFDGDVTFAVSLGEHQAELNTVGLLAKQATMLAVLSAVRSATGKGGVPSAAELGRPVPQIILP